MNPNRHRLPFTRARNYRAAYAIALASVLLALPVASQAAAPQVRSQAPGYYRMMLGDFEITALLDGTHPFPVDDVMVGGSHAKVSRLLARADVARPVEGSINAFLVNTGDRLVLIDAGAGALYGACCGHLLANLRAAGYEPEQVDEVYLTHLHQDHVGGIDANGTMAFPNAFVRVSQADADYWLDPAHKATAPAYLGAMFDAAARSLAPYIAAGRLKPFGDGAELGPGITPLAGPGHTPGQTWYRVRSRGQTLLVWGDVVHVAPVQFASPAVGVKYDSDATQAVRKRRRVFADAARDGHWIAAAHVSFPGLGHVRRQHGHFEWLPAPYTTWMVPPTPR